VTTPANPPFFWSVRVYYEDTDSGGVVYHANYLKFLERARSEWLRAAGFGQPALRDQFQILFAVHTATLTFRQPARFDDLLDVSVAVTSIGGAAVDFAQHIYRQQQLLLEATIRVAAIDADRFLPRRLPTPLRQFFTKVVS